MKIVINALAYKTESSGIGVMIRELARRCDHDRINSFVQRRDFGTFHVRLHNCFILRENSFQMAVRPVVPAKIKTSFKAKIYNKLWPLYMRLPAGFRRVLKKMLRGWFFTEERR